MRTTAVVLASLVVVGLATKANALKCYECATIFVSDCQKIESSINKLGFVRDCAADPKFNNKTCIWTMQYDNGQMRRDCGRLDDPKFSSWNSCTTDLCNNVNLATGVSTDIWLVCSTVFVATLLVLGLLH